MSIDSLLRIMPPPKKPVEALGSWDNIEELLGVKLPSDYKEFIEAYGSGIIGHFVSVLNPFSSRPGLNLVEQSTKQLDALRTLHNDFGEPNPYELYPCSGGLLPIAITDNGDVIYWLTKDGAAGWTIVVNEARSPDYQNFECNLTAFLDGILNKSIICKAFPISVFENDVEFQVV